MRDVRTPDVIVRVEMKFIEGDSSSRGGDGESVGLVGREVQVKNCRRMSHCVHECAVIMSVLCFHLCEFTS